MKRVGQLLAKVAERGNLRQAFWQAARAKHDRREVAEFAASLEEELERMREGLWSGDYPIGQYRRFTVFDPKERIIHAAAFRERVLQHALMNICEPVLERAAIFDSYACRRGKGQWAALARAQCFAGRQPFFLKMDIRKYFDSVSHDRLLDRLAARIKDPLVLRWFARIVATYETAPGRGLPIGSLSSQHLANFYLGSLDRYVKENLRVREYVRYMDDFVLWGSNSGELREHRQKVEEFLTKALALRAKDHPYINRSVLGMDFLGARVWPGYLTLNRRSRRRFDRKLRDYEERYEAGAMTEHDRQRRVDALLGFARQVCSWRFRRRILDNLGRRLTRLEPREPRRQLEQQRPELPVGESQQERSGLAGLRPGISPGPGSGSLIKRSELCSGSIISYTIRYGKRVG